jgi:hypothetical protein
VSASSSLRVAGGGEQARAGGEEDALVVDLDGAALQHVVEREATHAEVGRDGGGREGIAIEGVLSAPRVEAPIGERHLAVAIDDEGGAVVAEPGVVERDPVEAHPGQVGSGRLQPPPGVGLGLVVLHVDDDVLEAGEGGDEPAELGAYGVEEAFPELVVRWPARPGGGMRAPLGRHAVAEVGGGGVVELEHGGLPGRGGDRAARRPERSLRR